MIVEEQLGPPWNLNPTPLNTFGINWTADVPQIFTPDVSNALVAKWANPYSHDIKLSDLEFAHENHHTFIPGLPLVALVLLIEYYIRCTSKNFRDLLCYK